MHALAFMSFSPYSYSRIGNIQCLRTTTRERHLGPGLSLVLLVVTKVEAPFFCLFALCDNLPTRCGYAGFETQLANNLLHQAVLAAHTHD